MIKAIYCTSAILILFSFVASTQAATITVTQQNKQFVPTTLRIKVGDSVNFMNEDPFYHNVFSLSDTKSFDLGSYPKGRT